MITMAHVRTVEVRGVPVQVEVRGTGGTPLLAIHGWGVDRRLMTGCLEPVLADDDAWLRIYPDLAGMGATPGDPRIDGSDAMLELVSAVADAVCPGEPFAVVGESYGGYLARGLARQRPDQVLGLLLLCPSMAPGTPADADLLVLERDEGLLASLDDADRAAFTDVTVRQTRPVWDSFAADVLPGIRAADQAYLSQVLAADPLLRFDPDDADNADGPTFGRPVLVVVGRQDSYVGYRRQWELLARYPRASFAVLDRAGHNLQAEQPEVFAALLREWLERVELDRVSRA